MAATLSEIHQVANLVFPTMLAAVRGGGVPDFDTVAIRLPSASGGPSSRWQWGSSPRPVVELEDLLPPPDAPVNHPDANGMAYLETSRGCPLRCAFCCYNLRRSSGSSLAPESVFERVRILRRRGAREIRLVDPTFNAHPSFDAVVEAMTRANTKRAITFFIEIRADTLTDDQARRLASAGVMEAEVGIQSTDPRVLRVIRRGTDPERTLQGIEHLRRHGIRPTIDFMYALPRQGRDDLARSLAWLERFPDAHPQFLPLLLLPGTELRDRAGELGLKAQRLPPYRVLSTDCLTSRDLREVEADAVLRFGTFDAPTRRFAGRRLPDLFADRQTLDLDRVAGGDALPNTVSNRQVLVLRGTRLFEKRERIAMLLCRAVRAEPDILWQFVIEPRQEEPLDLLDSLLAALRRLPSHWLDRLVAPAGKRILAARRLFVSPAPGTVLDPDWIRAADDLLAEHSH